VATGRNQIGESSAEIGPSIALNALGTKSCLIRILCEAHHDDTTVRLALGRHQGPIENGSYTALIFGQLYFMHEHMIRQQILRCLHAFETIHLCTSLRF